jgi:hypothetical protein
MSTLTPVGTLLQAINRSTLGGKEKDSTTYFAVNNAVVVVVVVIVVVKNPH